MADKQIIGVDDSYRTHSQTLTAVSQVTDPHLLANGATVRAFGPATAATLVVEQHPVLDPSAPASNSPYWRSALSSGDAAYTGNPNADMPPDVYADAGASWWRVRVAALTGATVEIMISGEGF